MHLFRQLLVVSSVAVSGCLPAVTHGPRVEAGNEIGLSVSPLIAGSAGGVGSVEPALLGSFGVDLGHGFVPRNQWMPAIRVGAEVNLLPPRLDPDLYVQLPRPMLLGLDAGVGMSASFSIYSALMPYAQLGWVSGSGRGAWLTGGYVSVLSPDSASTLFAVVPRVDTRQLTATVQLSARRYIYRLFVTQGFSVPYTRSCQLSPPGECPTPIRTSTTLLGASILLPKE